MPILHEFSRVNKLFQLENGNAFKMLDCLQSCFRTLISKVITPSAIPPSDSKLLDVNLNDTANHLPVCVVNFGVQFSIALGEAKFDSTIETNMKNRCRDFLLKAAKQVQNRLPANITTWKSMTSFSPSVILSQNKPQLATVCILPRCLSNIGLYGNGALSLPISSLVEEYKCAKTRLEMMLKESRDPCIRDAAPTLATGRKWIPTTAVADAKAALRHRDIVGQIQYGRGGLGLGITTPTWQKATSKEQQHLVVEEVRHQEEAIICAKAVSQAQQLPLDEVGRYRTP